jgi:hypothetical protein
MLLRLGGQDGFIRESVKVFVVVMIIFVVLLDAHAVFDNRRQAADDAHAAALAAAAVYAETRSDALAKQEAERALDASSSTFVAFKAEHLEDSTFYTVTATREASTYLFHYVGSFPAVGTWAQKVLHPAVSSNNDIY